MADSDNVREFEFLMEWSIENYIYCWHKKGEKLTSPAFVSTLMGNTKWKLLLYPSSGENENYIGCFLHREEDEGPEKIEVYYNFEVLGNDHSILTERKIEKREFKKGVPWGKDELRKWIKVLKIDKESYLPLNILTIRCRMGRCDTKCIDPVQMCAKTVISFEKRSFFWAVEKFNSLHPNRRIPFTMESTSKEILMKFCLFVSEGQNSDEIVFIEISCFLKHFKYFILKIFLIDNGGKKNDCGELEFWYDVHKNTAFFPLRLTKNKLLESKGRYLKEDVLTLNCECIFPTGISFEGVVSTDFEQTSPQTKNVFISSVPKIDILKKSSDLAIGLKEDFETLYKEGILSDIKLYTKTKSFPAHAAILSARSPVFKAMISYEMKEKIERSVDILDLDDDTVRRMILYMYTDALEDLEWESTFLLYQAADKYQILSLRGKCLAFLGDRLSLTNACEALVLADKYQDEDFKKIVQNYIVDRDKYVFISEEWKILMKNNSELAAETMHHFWGSAEVENS
ncbi:TD and POZ domain-containing protein 5 [Nephila pilipes]|uniref:TD and POZ domain-containing protein 5 n=1 Tax=Nephila pilipes TaxID=299642 RepID=A0A8X6Q7E9_NEPPI|nr:TD and POZ domain-containing protein 5 [Nephila pilipes]